MKCFFTIFIPLMNIILSFLLINSSLKTKKMNKKITQRWREVTFELITLRKKQIAFDEEVAAYRANVKKSFINAIEHKASED